jgi:hypothetical protein
MVQRSVLNLHHGETLFEYRNINLVKIAQRVNGVVANRNALDYPTEAVTGQSFTMYFPDTATYVARWTGSGSFDCGGASKTNSSSGIYTGGGADGSVVTNGRFTFTKPADNSFLSTIKGTTIDNLLVCLLSEEALYDAGDRYRPRFKELITEFNPDCLRLMDLQLTNFSHVGRDWAEMPSIDRLNYESELFIAAKNVGVATGTNDYVAASYTGMPATYEHGEFFHCTFQNSNTSATCTLDSGGRGAKSIGQGYAGPYPKSVAIGGSNTDSIILNTQYTCFYDKFYDQWMFHRGDRGGATMGYPIPALIEMCNEVGYPGWFCIPYFASDAWITSFANLLVTDYLPYHDFVKIEFGNEPWNSLFALFHQAARAGTLYMGLNGGDGANHKGYVGMRFREIAQIMQPIFDAAGYGAKLQMVLATNQNYGASDMTTIRAQVENLLFKNTSTATTGTIEGNHTPAYYLSGANAPILFATHVSYARYYYNKRIQWLDSSWTTMYNSPPVGVSGIDDVLAAADDFALGTDAGKNAAFDFLASYQLSAGTSFANCRDSLFPNFNTLAEEYNVKVAVYEANHEQAAPSTAWCTGKSIDASYGGVDGLIDRMLQGWFNSTQYESTVTTFLTTFYGFSQSESWSLFAMGTGSPWQSFPLQSATSLLGGDTTQEGLANWRANATWNNLSVTETPTTPTSGGSGKGKGKGNSPKRGLITATPRLTWSKKKSTSAVAQVTEAVKQVAKVYPEYRMDFAEERRHIANLLLADNTLAQLRKIESAKVLADKIAQVIEEDDEEVLLLM